MLVQLQKVSFGYAGHEILQEVSWGVAHGEKVGLVGPNGCGKSTLLHILRGALEPHSGEVTTLRGTQVGFLSQTEPIWEERTLHDSLLSPFEEVLSLRGRLRELEKGLEETPGDEGLLTEYGKCQAQYETLGGYTLEKRIEELLADLGFQKKDLNRQLSSFSGGEVGRVALLKVLVRQPDLLLLDEPTNHLDIEATERLETILKEWTGSVLLVSHDRAFLNAVCTKIVEIVGGKLEEFRGNFDDYKTKRAKRLEVLEKQIEKQRKEIERLERYVAKNQAGQKARQASSKKKAIDRMDRIEIPEDPWVRADAFKLDFEVGNRPGGKQVATIEELCLGYEGEPPLIQGFSTTIYRGDRIGIVGPNGCGKSTLLKVLMGKETPRQGRVELGKDVGFGVFDQNRTDLDRNGRLVDEVLRRRREISEGSARSILGSLRFSGDDAFRPVSSLSGGEKNRLSLGLLAMTTHNALALDEPTNHLDIPARQALEEALSRYRGTLLVVSHDRYFLDQLVDKIFFFKGDATVEVVLGSYSEARKKMKKVEGDAPRNEPDAAESQRAEDKAARIASREERKQRQRAVERKKRLVKELEETIDTLERDIERLEEGQAAQSDDWSELAKLTQEKEDKERQLDEAMKKWEQAGKDVGRLESALKES